MAKKNENKSLTDNTLHSAHWGIGKTIAQSGIGFISGIVLARIIAPEEFGIFSIAMIFIGLGNVFASFSITPTIIKKRELSVPNIYASISISIILSVLLFVILWVASPFIAWFFEDESITSVIRVIAFSFILNSYSGVSRGLLMREFSYKPIFYVEVVSMFISSIIISIPLAILGFGVWSLVFGVLAQSTLCLLFYLYLKFYIGIASLKDGEYKWIFKFSMSISAQSLFNYLSQNIDNFIIGRYLTNTQLGLYSKAYGLMSVPSRNISYSLGGISISAFSSVQHDKFKLKRGYYKATGIISLIAFPVTLVMTLLPDYLIIGLFGSQWFGAIIPFQILSISVLFKVYFGVSGGLLKSIGLIAAETKRQLIYTFFIGAISLLLIDLGIVGVSIAISISSFIFFVLMQKLVLECIDGSWIELFSEFKGGVILAILLFFILFPVKYFLDEVFIGDYYSLRLFISLIITGITFFAGIILFPEKLIGKHRNWLVIKYSDYIPASIAKLVNVK